MKMTRRAAALQLAATVFAVGCGRKDTSNKPAANKTTVTPMNDPWTRIHSWLTAHAPKISRSLGAPATVAELATAEKALGREMPQEWRDLYQKHDGMSHESNLGSLFFGMQFLTLEEVVMEHSNSNLAGDEPLPVRAADPGINRADMHNPKWIAFASDSGETQLRVDTDPARGGTMGQVIFTDHADSTVIRLAPSLSQFLDEFANDLDGGKYSLNQEALADGNEFLDCAPEIDIVNWHHSPRWKHLAR